VHTVKDVNRKLERGWYFFADVYEEGIMLYDSYRYQLAEPKDMTLAQRRDFAQLCLDEYLGKGDRLYGTHELQIQQSWLNEAAFMLHQATETYYKTMLMVFTAYRPKQHNIEKLGNRCRNLHEARGGIFPRDTPEDEARFKLLKAAYVDARYSMKYSITREELDNPGQPRPRAPRPHRAHLPRAHRRAGGGERSVKAAPHLVWSNPESFGRTWRSSSPGRFTLKDESLLDERKVMPLYW
jgi:HEPN domain-containing protein